MRPSRTPTSVVSSPQGSTQTPPRMMRSKTIRSAPFTEGALAGVEALRAARLRRCNANDSNSLWLSQGFGVLDERVDRP